MGRGDTGDGARAAGTSMRRRNRLLGLMQVCF
jgi:hypothetical protein